MADSSKQYVVSVEVLKYPYCGTMNESKEFLSEKICRTTIQVRQKIIQKAKSWILYLDFMVRVTSLTGGIVPSQAIGLGVLPNHPPIIRSLPSETSFHNKIGIAPVMEFKSEKIVFTEEQMDTLYQIALKCSYTFMSQEELIAELRGGDLKESIAAIGVIMAFMVMLKNIIGVEAFQVPPNPGAIPPPHLSWLYGNSKPDRHFGFETKAGPRSVIVTDATRNAGSEKNEPFKGSSDSVEMIEKLYRFSRNDQPKTEIPFADATYTVTKPSRNYDIDKLILQLATQIYQSIRDCDTDISDIARNLGFKPENVKKIKEHVFFNQHYLDRHSPPEPIEYKRFDPDLEQALAWKRLEVGTHIPEDIIWMKHECRERLAESIRNCGYSQAHDIAEKHFPGAPWDNNY